MLEQILKNKKIIEMQNANHAIDGDEWELLMPSLSAQRTKNPIRAIVDHMKSPPNPALPVIPLSIGDPTVFGNLKCPDVATNAIVDCVRTGKYNGYPHSAGTLPARSAVAKKFSIEGRTALTADDVILASGCSGALEIAISTLVNEGDNILVPRPGFPLYNSICVARGASVKHYDLLPQNNWEADLHMMEALIDNRTRAILVNNPSNPCGCVYSETHLRNILAIAFKHKLVVIADEIYAGMAFATSGATFLPLASLTKNVPIISVGGLAKQYIVPGWRLGWIICYDDEKNSLKKHDIYKGLMALTQLILGPNSIIQGALPTILFDTPDEFYDELLKSLETQSLIVYENLSKIAGLSVVKPQGAMYVMVRIDPSKFKDIKDDVQFADYLYGEQSVQILPGQVFDIPNFFRIVFCAPPEKLKEACDRMHAFCKKHYKLE